MIYLIFITGIIIGALIFYWVLMQKAPGMMILENESRYNLGDTERMIIEAATSRGWKNPVNHDLQQTMKNNGLDVRPVKVIEICKPEYAYQILSENDERIVSSLMPCRIALYERFNGRIYVSRLNSALMSKPMKGVIPAVMKKATVDVEEMLKPLFV